MLDDFGNVILDDDLDDRDEDDRFYDDDYEDDDYGGPACNGPDLNNDLGSDFRNLIVGLGGELPSLDAVESVGQPASKHDFVSYVVNTGSPCFQVQFPRYEKDPHYNQNVVLKIKVPADIAGYKFTPNGMYAAKQPTDANITETNVYLMRTAARLYPAPDELHTHVWMYREKGDHSGTVCFSLEPRFNFGAAIQKYGMKKACKMAAAQDKPLTTIDKALVAKVPKEYNYGKHGYSAVHFDRISLKSEKQLTAKFNDIRHMIGRLMGAVHSKLGYRLMYSQYKLEHCEGIIRALRVQLGNKKINWSKMPSYGWSGNTDEITDRVINKRNYERNLKALGPVFAKIHKALTD